MTWRTWLSAASTWAGMRRTGTSRDDVRTAPRRAARRRARLAAAGVASLLIAGCAALGLRGSFEQGDLAWEAFALTVRQDAGLGPRLAPIAIVAYDDATAQALHNQWDRATMAHVVDLLHGAGARVIVLDILYEDGRPHTAALAAAMRRAGNVVLGQELAVGIGAYTETRSVVPLESHLAAAARAVGLVNVPPAVDDKTMRRYYTAVALDSTGHSEPSLAVAAARAYGSDIGDAAHGVTGPTFLINFAGSSNETFPTYSYATVLAGRQDLSALAGKIVLVGDEVAADGDLHPTPVDRPYAMFGVELHAHALNTLLDGHPLVRPPSPIQVALTFPAALLAVAWALRRRLLATLVLALSLMVALLCAAFAALLVANVWLDVSAPLLATILAPLGALGVRLGTEERANRDLRTLFGRYVAPPVVARIVDDPDSFGLDGELREITVLFSDIRNFTTISEPLPPQHIVRMLSRYFAAMVEEIQAQGGTVDKYVGDSVMALFGAPDDQPDAPARAIRAALAMQRRLDELNATLQTELGHPIASGIGLHHGLAAVGVIGAPSKREYSAIGDTVNTASRLEGLTKTVGYPIVASAEVVAALPEELRATLALHDLGEVAVKGRGAPVHAFGLSVVTQRAVSGAGSPTVAQAVALDNQGC